jgi:hypothetical protein
LGWVYPIIVIARFMRATHLSFFEEAKMGCPDKPGNDKFGVIIPI